MGQYDSPKRPLSWELRDPLVLSRTTEEDADCGASSFVWPEDSDQRVPIVFNLSLNEFVVLASTIDVGSDIAYGEDAIRVWWLWDRVLRCPMSLCDAIVQAIQTCPDVQEELIYFIGNAIGNDPIVQEQLRTFVVGDQLITDYIQTRVQEEALSPASRNMNLLREDVCTDPELYNQAVTIADELGNMSNSLFTAINVASDVGQAVSILLAAIPWTGVSLIPSVVELLAAELLATFQAAYVGGSIAVDMQDLYCELWCEMRLDCSFSIDQMFQFYVGKLGQAIPDDPGEAMLSIIGFIVGGTSGDIQAYYGMHVFMLACIRVTQDVLGYDLGSFAQTVRNAGTVANNGYLACDPCTDPDCYDPDNFHAGTVTEQDGLEYTVEGELGLTIVWGQNDLDGPVCELQSFETLSGFVSTGTMLDEFLVSRSFTELPLRIRYLDMGAGAAPLVVKFNFS